MRKAKIEKINKLVDEMTKKAKAIMENESLTDCEKGKQIKELSKTTAWKKGAKLYYAELDYESYYDADGDLETSFEENDWYLCFKLDGQYDFSKNALRSFKHGVDFYRSTIGGRCDRAFMVAYCYGQKNGKKLYAKKMVCEYHNSDWRIMKELADFRLIQNMRDKSWDVAMSTPVRWMGAFNTGTEGDKEFTFREALEWETSEKDREVAAQLFDRVEEIGEQLYNGDSISYCKLGIIYSPEDIVEAYDSDAYTRSLGPILIPSNDRCFFNRREYSNDSIVINIVNYFESCYDIHELDNYEGDWDTHNCPDIKNISDVINDMFTEDEIEKISLALTTKSGFDSANRKREFKEARAAFKFIQHCIQTRKYYVQWEFKRRWHSEGIVAVGAKPQGIVVRGEITPFKYKMVQEIAIKKGLYILHV